MTESHSMTKSYPIPVIGFAAYSGTGKTALLKKLLPRLTAQGLRIGMIKHAHHRFDIDHPGKDSFELRKAGAEQMLIASGSRWALMTDTPDREEEDPDLMELLARLDTDTLDLVLVEGFKTQPFNKIELQRPSLGKPLLYPTDSSIIAVATDAPLAEETTLPLLDLNDPAAIAHFIISHSQLLPATDYATANHGN